MKIKLSSRAVEALMLMHLKRKPAPDRVRATTLGRTELFNKGLCCYTDGWTLTLDGKQVARHLAGGNP